jgi:N-glycosylase/DNA lyase
MREYIIEYRFKKIVDLEATLDCGQSFVWQKTSNAQWQGWIGNYPTQVCKIDPNKLILKTQAPELLSRAYFQVDQNWDAMIETFPKDDQILQSALRFAGGMILLRQPIWETTVSFILSAQKQIPHIRILILRLRERFGKRLANNLYTFPSPRALAQASENDLRACGLGFRAKSLSVAARQIESGEVALNSVSTMDYQTARAELQKLRGVGPKIADCICLFVLGHYQAFPMDTWMIRMIREIYFPRKRILTRSSMEQFASIHFGRYGGYAQQILFHWMRKLWSRTKNKGTPHSSRVPSPRPILYEGRP